MQAVSLMLSGMLAIRPWMYKRRREVELKRWGSSQEFTAKRC